MTQYVSLIGIVKIVKLFRTHCTGRKVSFSPKNSDAKDDGGEEMLKLKSDRVNRFSHPQLEIGKNKKNIISAIIIRWASHLNLSRILYRMKCSLKHIKPQ